MILEEERKKGKVFALGFRLLHPVANTHIFRTHMRSWCVWLVCFAISAAIAREKDPRPNSSEKLKQWRHVKRFAEHEPPAIATPQSRASALGRGQVLENDGGKLTRNFTRADSDADTERKHGLDHPTVVVDIPWIECKCKDLHHASTNAGRAQGGAASSVETSACREGVESYWVFSVRGLVAEFVYEVQVELNFSGESTHWKTVFMPSTDLYTVKHQHPLRSSQKTLALNTDHTSHEEPFFVEATVRDMHPGLTREEALISNRLVSSTVNTVRVYCIELESGERTTVPEGEQDVGTVKDDNEDLPIGNKVITLFLP